jgi:hypothetical protein
MSDTVETEETKDPDEPKGLRKQLADAHARLKVFEVNERQVAFNDAGLDTSTGIGKAIAQVYEGDVSKDAIRKFATDEYGVQFENPEETHAQATEITQAQERLDGVTETAGSVAELTAGDALAKAEADGDYITTMAIKGQRVADSLFRS